MKNGRSKGFSTRAIHDGQDPEPITGAVVPPIFQTSTFAQRTPGEMMAGYDYSRAGNPTRTALEKSLASLEGGAHAVCFSSGMGAISAVIHLLSSGDHVLLCDDVYGGTFRLFDKIYKQLGIQYSCVDMTDLQATERAFRPNTKLVWVETPTNPMLKIIDIEGIASLCRKKGCMSAVDNTFATPYLQNPLALGIDIVCHSTTKYLGGHSDVIGGALIVDKDDLATRLHFVEKCQGAVPGPFDCFLTLRSVKTLAVRMDRHCANAARVAEFLESHRAVERVVYPGLRSHPQYDLAKRQMRGAGGMITMMLKGSLDDAKRFLERVQIFLLAESLGGVESLIEHPAIMTHASVPPEQRKALGISDTLVRLSVGIEDSQDLIEDLQQALA